MIYAKKLLVSYNIENQMKSLHQLIAYTYILKSLTPNGSLLKQTLNVNI